MLRQDTVYMIVVLFSALVSGVITLYSWRRRQVPAASAFVLLMLAVTIWLMGYAFELKSETLPAMLLWIKVGYIGVATVPTLWLIFALHYAGKTRWLTRRTLLILAVMPTLILLSNWTNEFHRLYYTEFYVDTSGPFPRFALERGWMYWLGVVYSYLALLASTIVLFGMFIRTSRPYRSQIRVILLAASVPWIANFVYLSGLNPFPYLNLTPLAFALTGLLMAWGLFRFRLLDIIPVARDKVVESMRDGVVVLDAQERIVDLNPAALALIDRPAQNLIGQPAETVFPQPLDFEHHAPLSEGESAALAQMTWKTRTYDVLISPLYGRRHNLTGWIVVFHDMTERRQAEAALQQRTQELETRNAELDAFAHTVAHDLKTPLTVMLGFSKLLESNAHKMSESTMLENLQRISQTGHKMANIVDELLLLSSVREMREIELEPLDMTTIVAEALERMQTTVQEADAEIVGPETWPVVLGYDPWIEEVWVNYISNAVKYGGRPAHNIPPKVELGYEFGTGPETEYVLFWVRDNGSGLSEEQQTQLFTPFTRLHKVRAKGHGLGLSIARRIVERLGGKVGVESAPGYGSTFWFTLPVQD